MTHVFLTGGAGFGALDTRRDYIDVRDVAAALRALALHESASYSVFNVGTGAGVSVAELVDACRRITGRTLPLREDSARRRPVDRPSLVADPTALDAAVGWRAGRRLGDTLTELLLEPTPAGDR